MTIFAICLELLFSHMLVYTPWRRRRNALGAPCALCVRRRYAVTTLCTPRARRECSVTTQSIAGQNSVGARWHAVDAPRKRHCRRRRAVTSPCYGKCKIIRCINLRSHGALRNFKSPCQRHGIAVECDRGLNKQCPPVNKQCPFNRKKLQGYLSIIVSKNRVNCATTN